MKIPFFQFITCGVMIHENFSTMTVYEPPPALSQPRNDIAFPRQIKKIGIVRNGGLLFKNSGISPRAEESVPRELNSGKERLIPKSTEALAADISQNIPREGATNEAPHISAVEALMTDVHAEMYLLQRLHHLLTLLEVKSMEAAKTAISIIIIHHLSKVANVLKPKIDEATTARTATETAIGGVLQVMIDCLWF